MKNIKTLIILIFFSINLLDAQTSIKILNKSKVDILKNSRQNIDPMILQSEFKILNGNKVKITWTPPSSTHLISGYNIKVTAGGRIKYYKARNTKTEFYIKQANVTEVEVKKAMDGNWTVTGTSAVVIDIVPLPIGTIVTSSDLPSPYQPLNLTSLNSIVDYNQVKTFLQSYNFNCSNGQTRSNILINLFKNNFSSIASYKSRIVNVSDVDVLTEEPLLNSSPNIELNGDVMSEFDSGINDASGRKYLIVARNSICKSVGGGAQSTGSSGSGN